MAKHDCGLNWCAGQPINGGRWYAVKIPPQGEAYTVTDRWDQWCEAHGVYALNGGRRGWCGGANEYIRGADYLIMVGPNRDRPRLTWITGQGGDGPLPLAPIDLETIIGGSV